MKSYPLIIRESHIDTLGHMNNSTYLQIMEEARWEMLNDRGYGLEKVQRSRQGPVILEVNLKFLSELHLREKVRIETDLVDYKGKIGTLSQKVIREIGTVAAEAVFIFGLFDLGSRKLILPTSDWKRAVGLEE